jgi:hypothetical protein
VLRDWSEARHYSQVREARSQLARWHYDLTKPEYREAFVRWNKHPDNWQQMLATWQDASGAGGRRVRSAIHSSSIATPRRET